MNKIDHLDIAEIIDAYRIIPRIMWFFAMGAYFWFAYDSYMWIKSMENVSDTSTAFVGLTLTTLGGVVTLITNKYFETGRKWKHDVDS